MADYLIRNEATFVIAEAYDQQRQGVHQKYKQFKRPKIPAIPITTKIML
jgi:hypothetical protein